MAILMTGFDREGVAMGQDCDLSLRTGSLGGFIAVVVVGEEGAVGCADSFPETLFGAKATTHRCFSRSAKFA